MLSVKETKYVESRLAGKSQEEAGLEAGAKTIVGARALATRMSKKVEVIEAIKGLQEISLADAGITRTKVLEVIADALDATKIIVHGKTEEDSWVDVVPDHPIRLKAAEMSLKQLALIPEVITPVVPFDMTGMDEVELQRAVFKRTT